MKEIYKMKRTTKNNKSNSYVEKNNIKKNKQKNVFAEK